jgi:membrane-associated phospholipid phosphatase
MYVAASFVAASRVQADKHYSRDVIAGAALGIVSAHLVTQRSNRLGAAIALTPRGVALALRSSWR